jgi:hypothetical protein
MHPKLLKTTQNAFKTTQMLSKGLKTTQNLSTFCFIVMILQKKTKNVENQI